MTREDFKRKFYSETGEWLSNEEIDYYMEGEHSIVLDEDNKNIFNYNSNNKSFLHNDTEDNDILGSDLNSEVHDIFQSLVQKAKASMENKADKLKLEHQLDEFKYYGKLFLLRYLIYYTFQQGKDKGYMWRNL